jgi:hypothetical protein
MRSWRNHSLKFYIYELNVIKQNESLPGNFAVDWESQARHPAEKALGKAWQMELREERPLNSDPILVEHASARMSGAVLLYPNEAAPSLGEDLTSAIFQETFHTRNF